MRAILSVLILALCLCANAAVNFTEFYCIGPALGTNINAGSTTNATSSHTFVNGNWSGATGVYTNAGADLSTVTVGSWISVYTNGDTIAIFGARVGAVDDTGDTITIMTNASWGFIPAQSVAGNVNVKVGGAWAGPFAAVSHPFSKIGGSATNASGNCPRVNFKSAITFAPTATVTETNGTANTIGQGPVRFEGYTTTAGDGGRWTLDGGATGTAFCVLSNSVRCKNRDFVRLTVQNNGDTATADGVAVDGTENSYQLCVFRNLRGNGVIFFGVNHLYACEAFDCDQANASGRGGMALQASGSMAMNCISHHNTTANAAGFQLDGGINMLNCIAANNGNIGFRLTADVSLTMAGCSTFMNGGSGIDIDNQTGTISDAMVINIINCSFFSNASAGIRISTSGAAKYINGHIENCAFGSGTMTNVAGNFLSTMGGVSQDGSSFDGLTIANNVTLAADTTPWVAPLTGDFRNTATAVKSQGYGTYLQTYTTTTWTGTAAYPDIGAAQSTNSAAAGGTSGTFPIVRR